MSSVRNEADFDEANVTGRTAARLGWMAFAAAALMLVVNYVTTGLGWSEHPSQWDFLLGTALFSFSVAGVLIVIRRGRHPIGWIMLAIGISWEALLAGIGYASYGLVAEPGSLPAPDFVLALTGWLWVPGVGLVGTYLILLFPNGRLPSPRWRVLARLSLLALVLCSTVSLILPGRLDNSNFPGVTNPLGVGALRPLVDVLSGSVLILALCMVASAVALILRFRRSRGQERLQLKWLATAAAIVATSYFVAIAGGAFVALTESGPRPAWMNFLEGIAVGSFLLVPIAVGVAILRHHLYHIDIIVNRALVYGVLTTILSATYFVTVAILQGLLDPFVGESAIAVAASTLLIAALFRPARARTQAFIDRRFYRSRYDAVLTLERFSARLREIVDLDDLTNELIMVTNDVVQPSQLSVWLRTPSDRSEQENSQTARDVTQKGP
jgi:hypothetical protein